MSGNVYRHIFSDTPGHSEIIGAVSIYPGDDSLHLKQVAPVSRNLVDIFLGKFKRKTVEHAFIRAIARRLTHVNGGITAQNLNMLNMLVRILHNDKLTDDEVELLKEYDVKGKNIIIEEDRVIRSSMSWIGEKNWERRLRDKELAKSRERRERIEKRIRERQERVR